jgi:peptidoglycan/LPS O-acetylase OafA/YrhL
LEGSDIPANFMPPKNYFRDSSYLPTLDGWRALAIVYVSLDHSNLSATGRIGTFMQCGFLGVWIFFAISGLLICTRLLREESETGRLSLKSFYVRRVARIQPAALVMIGVMLVFGALREIVLNRWMVLGDIFQFEDYVDYVQTSHPWNWYGRHFWSLSVEEHFYLLLPFLLVVVVRHRLRIFTALAAVLIVWSFVMTRQARLSGHEAIHRTDLIVPALLIPAIFAIWIRQSKLAERIPWWSTLVCLAMVPLLINHHYAVPTVRSIHLYLTLPVLLSVSIIGTVQHPTSVLGRFLELRGLRFVGRISYSLYLYQQLFLVAGVPKAHGFLGALQRFPEDYACAFVLAVCSYYWIEKPCIRIGHRWAARYSAEPRGRRRLEAAPLA